MDMDALVSRFGSDFETVPDGVVVRCPAHSDSRPSLLLVHHENGKVGIHCRAGCSVGAVLVAAGLEWSDLFDVKPGQAVQSAPAQRPDMVSGAPVAGLANYVDAASGLLLATGGSEWTERARAYLWDRFGVDLELASELELGLDDNSDALPLFPYLGTDYTRYPRVTVPLRDFSGLPKGLQGRDISGRCPKRWLSLSNPDGMRWLPYGVFLALGAGTAIITEGPGDGLTARSAGHTAVVIRGASLVNSPGLAEELAGGIKGKRVYVSADRDEAGYKFAAAVAAALGAFGVEVLHLNTPATGMDLTDWREAVGDRFKADLAAAMDAAMPVSTGEGHAELDAHLGTVMPSESEADSALKVLERTMERYGASDVLNAHALVAWADGRIRYAEGLGFFVWDGRMWKRDDRRVRQIIHAMGAALTVAAAKRREERKQQGLEPDKECPIAKAAKGFTMSRRIEDLIRELRSVPAVYVDAEEFDDKPELLSFRNGTVDLTTGVLREHRKTDLLTVCLPMNYNPKAECKRWLDFLSEIFPDYPDMPAYMRRLVGYGITGSTDEQCFAVLYGKGANGKSVLTDVLSDIFAGITKTTPFSTFEERASGGIPNDIAALRGARLVMASEGEAGKGMSEAIIKRVTGKDKISARFLRHEFFEYKPTFLIMLATNHKPAFKGQDDGLWRRVKMLPFARFFKPEERDYNLTRDLMAEAEGIVAWAVRGAVEWFATGLQDPEVVQDSTADYKVTSDALYGFFPGALVPGGDSDYVIGTDAFNSYLEWCEAENLPLKERWTRRAFYAAMEERGVPRKRVTVGMALVGVKLAPALSGGGPGIFGGA
ncbi:phage/plasmid primase, P4 family [Kitasatospora purpeofusca]|uniref:phage/plasmid primase, P4 family n=1 Tax=Kitasatospora purpeofusca TaxID=67352 RepID=UPI0022563220|nr:phage/plasmid primase, P4 family [Kitasatospora purpeofusca]MCX4687314.1 phage/plasmid primase, P4 family [Kitasatospora purpeofusca]